MDSSKQIISSRLQQAAEAKKKGDLLGQERIYHAILSKSAGTNESALREQELALVQLGELYRDQRHSSPRPRTTVQPLADVV